MATILLLFIYIFYIGLGIPDSLLGSAWPAIYQEFHVPVSYASFVSAIISSGTVLSSLFVTAAFFCPKPAGNYCPAMAGYTVHREASGGQRFFVYCALRKFTFQY